MTDLDGAVTINESSADADFRVESNGNANMLVVDGGNDRVGIGISPSARLHVDGAEDYTGGIIISAGAQLHSWFLSGDLVNVHNVHSASASAAHTWQLNATEVVRITPSGLTFNGDTAAANALDDYEEGTWSVDLTGCDDNLSSPTGHYTKIGRLVYVYWYSGGFTISNASGVAFIGGLPFTVRSNSGQAYSTFQYLHGDAVDGNTTGGYFDHAATTMRFIDAGSTGGSTYVNGSRYIMISGVYETDS